MDIKPSNIIVGLDDKVKFIDFDIAREYNDAGIKDTELLGTAGYAAPEQFGFAQTDVRTDIYAFGILYNYLLTGKHIQDKFYDGTAGDIISKCISIDPVKRYQNAKEVKEALQFNSYERKNVMDGKFRFNLPGFRTGNPWHMIATFIYYR